MNVYTIPVIILFYNCLVLIKAQISFANRLLRRETMKEEGINHAFNTTADYIKFYGYIAEHHNILSPDGYLISVYRIPSLGSPILLQHGLLLASDSWVLQGPEYDLAFILFDRGYDVWIADNRGNTYSRAHVNISPEHPSFWNFSFHEMGFFDMPAVVDYILEKTNYKTVDVIGHSMGATSSFIMCSSHPEYNTKIRTIIAIAPAVFYNSTTQSNIQQILSRYGPYLKFLHLQHEINEFFPKNDWTNRASRLMCKYTSPMYNLCLFYMETVLGFSSITRQNYKSALNYAYAVPRGVSYKTLVHLAQLSLQSKLTHYDYGQKTNLLTYGAKNPPEYDLDLITTPVSLLYSVGDVHVSSEDMESLKAKLPNVVASYKVDKHRFNHLDFIWGTEAKNEVYDFILQLLSHFDNTNTDF